MEPISILLVGIGGYGEVYVRAVLESVRPDVKVVGAVDPAPERCHRLDELQKSGVPIYARLEDFYRERTADLAVISTPIHLHASQSIYAMEHGSHVLCEKPMTATAQDADAMIAARDRTGKQAYIGYQWCFSQLYLALKRDLMSGRYGRVLDARSLMLGPRSAAYYARSPWAGALKNGDNWTLDSVVANANAHSPNLLFFLMGAELGRAAVPVSVTAEVYRANPIENFDTCTIRAETDTGATLFYAGSHACKTTLLPQHTIRCEGATIRFGAELGCIATLPDGTTVDYGSLANADEDSQKLWAVVAAVRGEGTVHSTLESARSHVLLINGAYESADVVDFPEQLIKEQPLNGAPQRYIEGIDELMERCYRESILLSQTGTSWAQPGKTIDMRVYSRFPRK